MGGGGEREAIGRAVLTLLGLEPTTLQSKMRKPGLGR
jgi:hypothetical protein